MTAFVSATFSVEIAETAVEIAAISRGGSKSPIVFLHGFGSTKEDYADVARHADFDGRGVLAYDAPGFGETRCADLSRVDIPFLAAAALAAIGRAGFQRFHLIGHSMGGLTGLMVADAHPTRVLSFTNIEGNIAPEDCFLSREIVDHPDPDPERFFDKFIERTKARPAYASAMYAAALRGKARAAAAPSIFSSMVALSDQGGLMERFLRLPCPKMFMYGEDNASLSYLEHIAVEGVICAEIPACGHFPMYSNPPAMWRAIADFLGDL